MNTRKESLIILYFVSILLLPFIWATWSSASKILDVFFLHPADYVIGQAELTENICRKYGGGAKFNINYKGNESEGRDGCVLWADKGDLIKVYFNKHNLYDNGVISELINLLIGRLVLLLLLTFYFLRRLTIYRRLRTTISEDG